MAALLNLAPVGVAMAEAEGLPERGGQGVHGSTLCLFLMGARGGSPRFLPMSTDTTGRVLARPVVIPGHTF